MNESNTPGDPKMQSGLRTMTRNQWQLALLSKNMAVIALG